MIESQGQKIRHVHIGTGKLGLGFVGYFSHQLGFSTAFLNRDHEGSYLKTKILRENKRYLIKYYDNKRTEEVKFDDLYVFGANPEEIGYSIDLIADPSTKILTTSVGESQLQHIAPTVSYGLKKRDPSAPLFILACENGHRCSSEGLAKEVGKYLSPQRHGGIFIDCVVDQICDSIETQSSVIVSAESYREWIIEIDVKKRGINKQLKDLLNHEFIKFVPKPQINLYEIRKLWLVNGFHLALAVLGTTFLEKGVNSYIREVIETTDSDLSWYIEGIKQELATALICEDAVNFGSIFKQKEIDDYVDKIKERFKHSHDTCERILHGALLSEERITRIARQFANDLGGDKTLKEVFRNHLYECIFSFLKKVNDRLSDPLEVLFQRGGGVTSVFLPFVLKELMSILIEQGNRLRGSTPSE